MQMVAVGPGQGGRFQSVFVLTVLLTLSQEVIQWPVYALRLRLLGHGSV